MTKKLSYREYRNGTPNLVFLHGLMEDARMWDDFLIDLPFHCYAIDLPGYGGSKQHEFSSVAEAAKLVNETVEKLELKTFVLVGHSMGGYVALSYAKQFSDDLLGLGMIHSHPFADSEEKVAEREKTIDFINKFGLSIYAQQFFPNLFARSYKDNLAIHTLSLRSTQQDQGRVIQSMRALIRRPEEVETAKSLNMPSLWVLGTEDKLMDLERTLEVAATCDQAQIEIYENVGHMSMFEHTKVLRKDIIKFIRYCVLVNEA